MVYIDIHDAEEDVLVKPDVIGTNADTEAEGLCLNTLEMIEKHG